MWYLWEIYKRKNLQIAHNMKYPIIFSRWNETYSYLIFSIMSIKIQYVPINAKSESKKKNLIISQEYYAP